MTWAKVIVFCLGLMIGSFMNVLIHRLPRMIIDAHTHADATPRYDLCWPASHCPHCQSRLTAWQNIPVFSYVWLRGQCAFCGKHISAQYPIIELSTGLIWLLSIWHWGLNPTGFCWAGFVSVLLALSTIDYKTTLLPDDLTLTLVWGGLIACSLEWLPLPLTQSLWGAVIGYTSLWLIAMGFERITGKQGMGAGDFKLLAGLGAWLGPLALLPVVMLASISGAIVGLVLKFTNRLPRDGYLPFGPFLAVAAVIVAIIGTDLVAFWLR